MLKRKIEEKLNLWWQTKTSLFVNGARQVGKTFSIENFCKSKTNNYIYINFIEKSYLIPQIIKAKDAKSFLFILSTIVDQPLIKNDTIIFFDEIQYVYEYLEEHNIPKSDFDLVTLMKFLVEDNSYRYILSGSLLGVCLNDISSWPTGYMTTYTMYPLDFEEFMWANGINDDVIDNLKECFRNLVSVDEFLHEKIMDLFIKYVLVGGMPAAVSSYVNKNDMRLVSLMHQNIEMYNRKDITKYAPKDKKFYISQIYDLIPEEINKKNKRFSLGLIKNKNNHEIVEDSFLWLVNAGISIPVYSVDEPLIPLRASMSRRLLKLFHEDTGILVYSYMDYELINKIILKETSINFGGIYENLVACLLRSHGFDYLYYYNDKKNGEVDFLIEYQNKVTPIEVKSGKDYQRHSALNNLLAIKNYHIDNAFIFYNGNIKINEKKIYLPIYMVDFIKKRN